MGQVGDEGGERRKAREQKLEIGIHGTLDGELGAPGTKALTVGRLIEGGENSDRHCFAVADRDQTAIATVVQDLGRP